MVFLGRRDRPPIGRGVVAPQTGQTGFLVTGTRKERDLDRVVVASDDNDFCDVLRVDCCGASPDE